MSELQEQWEWHAGNMPPKMDGAARLLRTLQETDAVHRFGKAVLVTRFEDVSAIHRDTVRYSSRPGFGSVAEQVRASLNGKDLHDYEELQHFRRLLMAREDGDQHRRLRAIAHRAFTPRRVAAMTPHIQKYMDGLIRDLEAPSVVDISEVAYRLPLMVIGDFLDVPGQDREQMHDWTRKFAEFSTRTDPPSIRQALQPIHEFQTYSNELLLRWQEAPQTSELVAALVAGDDEAPLTPLELAGMFVQLIVAGHETTAHLISRGVYELMRHPDEWRTLCADPEGLAANATEELLRYVSPLQWQMRVAKSDVVIADAEIEAGTTVCTLLAAANRDPEVFEEPDVVDIRRKNARQHLAFGLGTHFCLGASLARLEGTIAFKSLARRFPNMKVISGATEWAGTAELPGLPSFKVAV
jgi:cytochrome P450